MPTMPGCAHADPLDAAIGAWFAERDAATILKIFDEADVVAGPVLYIRDIFADPHYRARENIVSVPDEDFGEVRMQSVVPKFADTPGHLGRDNVAVNRDELGLDDAELRSLKAAGII